jgi:hypothetical protein
MTVSLNCSGCNKPHQNPSFTALRINEFDTQSIENLISRKMPKIDTPKGKAQWDKLNKTMELLDNNPLDIYITEPQHDGKLHAYISSSEYKHGMTLAEVLSKTKLFGNYILDFFTRTAQKAESVYNDVSNVTKNEVLKKINPNV